MVRVKDVAGDILGGPAHLVAMTRDGVDLEGKFQNLLGLVRIMHLGQVADGGTSGRF